MKIIDALVDDISKVPHIGVLTNPWLTVGVVLQDAYILIFVATETNTNEAIIILKKLQR